MESVSTVVPALSASDTPTNANATNPASSNNATRTNTNTNRDANGQAELEAALEEHFGRFQQLLGRAFEGTGEDVPVPTPTTGSNPSPDSNSNLNMVSPPPSAATNASASTNSPQTTNASTDHTTTRPRGSGGIGRDLGEGHAGDDEFENEEDELLARLAAGMSPQETQRLRATMAQMQNMFSGSTPLDAMFGFNPQMRREERDHNRDQFSGMYS